MNPRNQVRRGDCFLLVPVKPEDRDDHQSRDVSPNPKHQSPSLARIEQLTFFAPTCTDKRNRHHNK
jgi:hypothetical protein